MSLLDDLLHYYKLDEASGNAVDAHGSSNLTDNNTVGTTTGLLNGARSYNGTDEYHSFATNLLNGLSTFSASCWIKNTRASLAFRPDIVFESYDNPTTGDGIVLGLDGGAAGAKLRLRKSEVYATGVALSDSSPSVNTWYHVVATVSSGGTLTLYINGVAQATTGTRSGTLSNNTEFRLGAGVEGGATHWQGPIDEVGLWSRELTSAEVTELYNSGTPLDYDDFGGGGGGITADVPVGLIDFTAPAIATAKSAAVPIGLAELLGVAPAASKSASLTPGLVDLTAVAPATSKSAVLSPAAVEFTGQPLEEAQSVTLDPAAIDLTAPTPATAKTAAVGIALVELAALAPSTSKSAAVGFGSIEFVGIAPGTVKQAAVGVGLIEFVAIAPTVNDPIASEGAFLAVKMIEASPIIVSIMSDPQLLELRGGIVAIPIFQATIEANGQ